MGLMQQKKRRQSTGEAIKELADETTTIVEEEMD
jgi:hypothetical protein